MAQPKDHWDSNSYARSGTYMSHSDDVSVHLLASDESNKENNKKKIWKPANQRMC
jgi:hypothetical protein